MDTSPIRDGQFNIGHICTRQQCDDGKGEKIAFRWISATMETESYTFSDLEIYSNKFANLLQTLGFSAGETVFTFLPKMPEQFFTILGILKLRAVAAPLFSNFGEEALLDRLGDARAIGVVTKKSLIKKVTKIRDRLPSLKYIIVVDSDAHISSDILSYRLLMNEASDDYTTGHTAPDTPSLLHYTSGSTGKPKGVLHAHRSLMHQCLTAKEVLNLSDNEIFWCTADQGWVTGTSYGIIGPWSLGITQVHYGGGYDAEAWFGILEREKVTIWYTAPTALRMLMREDAASLVKFELGALKHIFSVGEPLNPEVITWSRKKLGKDIHDTWFQTETGAIMIANRPGLAIKPGSMGKPVIGVEATILGDDGNIVPDMEPGNLCLKAGWQSMFKTYLNSEEVYRQKFRNDFYCSGDSAYRDDEGYFWFLGRSDDVINTAGHLVSPFEVESALLEIEEVAESGVVGIPDEVLYEKVVAFVCVHKQYEASDDLELKIRIHVSNKVSSIATPQKIIFVDSIPKNKSGKIMRRLLRAWYAGTDIGDISTLEV